MHTNGIASKERSDAGLVLKNPNDDEITYALRFDFQVSNNEVEYEALLAGLHLAREVGAKHFSTFSDSLLITNQVNETCEAKYQRMQRYLDANLTRKKREGRSSQQISINIFRSLDQESVGRSCYVKENKKQIDSITMPPDWTKLYPNYLLHDVLPNNPVIARKIVTPVDQG